MEIGVSTSCFYPMNTEIALENLAHLGVKTTEVFFNTHSELKKPLINQINSLARNAGISIGSVHPFTSFAEPFVLFSAYERRFEDGLEFYKNYFEAMNILDSKILVIHGDGKIGVIEEVEYFERFLKLFELGKKFGVVVAQENVNKYRSENPHFLVRMKDYMGENFKMVFDIKQSVRAGYDPFEFVDLLGESFVHVHLSDHNKEFDCLPPGKGEFNFKKFFEKLNDINYTGNGTIELYSKNYKEKEELLASVNFLNYLKQNDSIML